MDNIRVGIVGSGGIGKLHAVNLAKCPTQR